MAPIGALLDVRVNWRANGHNVADDNEANFRTGTSGWSISAGINAAATSITRITGDGAQGDREFLLGGAKTCGSLVTTSTDGSGFNYDFGTTQFTSGRTYRWRAWLKSVSGTTSAKLIIGSLGTPADRGTQALTITTSWVSYEVDWTPSANRTDVEAVVANGTAAAMTARISLAEVYESLDDITGDVLEARWQRGASFDGGTEAPGLCILTVRNDDNKYDPDNTSSSLSGLLTLGRKVLIRSSYANLVYGHFYGTLRRIIPRPSDRQTELHFQDPLYDLSRSETNEAVLLIDIRQWRLTLGTNAGFGSLQFDASRDSPELLIPVEGTDRETALSLLTEFNQATGSVHFIRAMSYDLFTYICRSRVDLATGGALETLNASSTGVVPGSYDLNDEAITNTQRVTAIPRAISSIRETVWIADSVPFTIPAGTSRTIWPGALTEPIYDMSSSVTATNSPTITFTAAGRSAKIVITAGGSDSAVTAVSLNGFRCIAETNVESAQAQDATSAAAPPTGYGERVGGSINSRWLPSVSLAQGLADSIVQRYKDPKARPPLTLINVFPTQLRREVADRIALTSSRLSFTAKEFLIRSFVTTVTPGTLWETVYQLEEAPTVQTWFTVGGTADEGVGGTGILAY